MLRITALLVAALTGFGIHTASYAVPFEARPPHLRDQNIFDDQTFVDALSDARLREIVADIRAKRTDVAKKKLVLFLKALLGNIQAIEILGTLLQNEGKYEQAEKLLKQAATVAPRQVSLRFRLAVTLLNQQKFNEAAPHLQFAIEQEPDNTLALTNYGWMLAVMNRNQQALAIYERLKAPKYRGKISATDLFVGLTILYHRLGRHDDTIALLTPEFEKVKATYENNRVFLNLFDAHLQKKQFGKAASVLARLETVIPPAEPGPAIAAVRLAAATGKHADAEKRIAAGLKKFPESAVEFHLASAQMNLDRKYYKWAEKDYVSAAKAATPENRVLLLSDMSQALAAAGRRANAVAALENFVSAAGNEPDIAMLLAENLGQMRETGRGIKLLDDVIRSNPKNPRAYFLKAVLLRVDEKRELARTAMRKSVELDPYQPAAWQLLADLNHDIDGDAAMIGVLKQGLDSNPTDPQLLLGVGSLSYSEGDLETAKQTFQRMIARFPDDPIALSNAALASLDMGDAPDDAKKLLERYGDGTEREIPGSADPDPGGRCRAPGRSSFRAPDVRTDRHGQAAVRGYRRWPCGQILGSSAHGGGGG